MATISYLMQRTPGSVRQALVFWDKYFSRRIFQPFNWCGSDNRTIGFHDLECLA